MKLAWYVLSLTLLSVGAILLVGGARSTLNAINHTDRSTIPIDSFDSAKWESEAAMNQIGDSLSAGNGNIEYAESLDHPVKVTVKRFDLKGGCACDGCHQKKIPVFKKINSTPPIIYQVTEY